MCISVRTSPTLFSRVPFSFTAHPTSTLLPQSGIEVLATPRLVNPDKTIEDPSQESDYLGTTFPAPGRCWWFAMSTQSEGRPPTERRRADAGYSNRGPYRQQPYDSNNQYSQPSNNAYHASSTPRTRHAGGSEEQLSNGNLSDSSTGGRYGRDKDRIITSDMPIRERSRTNGSSGPKRICDKCGDPLLGQFVRAMGGMFHLECFMCRVSVGLTLVVGRRTDHPIGLRPNRCLEILSR